MINFNNDVVGTSLEFKYMGLLKRNFVPVSVEVAVVVLSLRVLFRSDFYQDLLPRKKEKLENTSNGFEAKYA